MRSTSLGSPAHRAKPLLSLSIALLAAAAGCDVGNTPPPTDPQPPAPMKDLQEVGGAVRSWPGEAEASCGARLVVTRFNDDVGARAGVETRTLITTAEAYRSYFGHPAPAGVQLGREWVVFYSPGRTGGGYTPDVGVVGVRGDVLHVVTTLTAPIPPCAPPPMGGPTQPMTTPGSGSGSGSSGNTGSGVPAPTMPVPDAPAPPPATVAPPPGSTPPSKPRPPQNYVLVKFPAQASHSVEFQHQDINPGCPVQPNPCAAVLCAAGQMCVVLESYPPRAQCVPPPKPDPARCTSSNDCPAGTRCSTERGDCQDCGRGPGAICPAVCFGVCEPSSGQTCSGGAMMGGCRSAEDLKLEADKICRSSNQVLTDFALGSACFVGGFAEAKYTCCGRMLPPPVPPTSPGVCEWAYLGGDGSCKTYDAWKMETSEICQLGGKQLNNLSTGSRCTGDSFTEVKFECCAVKR